jgi:hypothetical protein
MCFNYLNKLKVIACLYLVTMMTHGAVVLDANCQLALPVPAWG